jgi:phytoene synthase
MADAATAYCAGLARRFDRERWLAALLAPPAVQATLVALLAFNYEVAKTRESVSQPMLGQIRLQWWREGVESIYAGRPRAHQVVEALAAAGRARPLDRAHFDRLIDARESDLDDAPFADLAALENYAEATAGGLALLGLEALGVEAAQAARKAGAAWALMGVLRAQPGLAHARRLLLPSAGLDAEDVFRGRATAEVRGAARLVLERAEALAAEARALRPPRAALAALPPLRLLDLHARRLRRAGFDLFAGGWAASDAGAPARIAWSRLAGL